MARAKKSGTADCIILRATHCTALCSRCKQWLKRSLEAVQTAHASAKPADLSRSVKVAGRTATVDGIYLHIIVHANEDMGQLIAYARMNGVKPPWSSRE